MDQKIEPRVREQTVAEALWEEGWRQGFSEGFAKGELVEWRWALREVLMHRFGPLPESVNQAIESMTDVEQVRHAFQKALRLDNLADLKL